MKKMLFVLLSAALCAALFVPATQASAAVTTPDDSYDMPYFEDATVMGSEVNVRLRPTTDAPIVLTLAQGARIGVFCEEVEGWYRIIYGNYRGYISKEFVFLPSTDYMVVHVLEAGLKLRQNPSTYSAVITELSEGTGLTVRNISGDWYYVEVPGDDGSVAERGYVHKDYVKISKAKTATKLLKIGMEGAEVKNVQQKLRERNFLLANATGYFGELTENAVKAFQRKAGLSEDGVVGQKTYDMLFGDNDITITKAELFGITGDVRMTAWNDVKQRFTRGRVATVTDVRTGKSYQVKRYGGTLHADVEPLTAEDTAIMKSIYGSWSWDRRAIWVTVGGVTYAASQNGMPHASGSIRDNNFDGHFCIHFKDSKTHIGNAECPIHQYCVKKAYDAAH